MRALCNHYQRRRQICDVLVPFFCSVILVPTNILMHNLGSFTMTTSIYAKYIFLARTNFMLCTCSFFSTDCILNNEILVRNGYSWTSASTLRSIFVIHSSFCLYQHVLTSFSKTVHTFPVSVLTAPAA